MQKPSFLQAASCLILLTLIGCASTPQPPEHAVQADDSMLLPQVRTVQEAQWILDDYARYRQALDAVKNNDDLLPMQYLATQRAENALADAVRVQWLASLGNRGQWEMFAEQYNRLPERARTQNVRCYQDLMTITHSKTVSPLARELARSADNLPASCGQLITAAAFTGSLDGQDAWRRVWVALAYNKISEARALAQALGEPLPARLGGDPDGTNAGAASALSGIITPTARNAAGADERLAALEASGSLNAAQAAFAHGILGWSQARDLNMAGALRHFQAADLKALNDDQWQWYARAALRVQQWPTLDRVIAAMPPSLQKDPAWQYWRARALSAQQYTAQAQTLYQNAAASGRNFYAILAQEALNRALDVTNNAPSASAAQVEQILQDGAIDHALVLFQASLIDGDRDMRVAAGLQWRYAVRDYGEDALLAAAQLAYQRQFYEMAIYSAERTNHKLNFQLRYLAPFRDLTERYAGEVGVDPAWVYGLIRQESRFMIGAKSRVGASGLMQIMPATAQHIARNIGLESYDVNHMETNIQMGTWYLADINRSLGDEVLATAGYNAGPSRARRWQASVPLEGAIYAETIPFNETRDYVKKVMANSAYYAKLFGEQGTLKQRLGTVAAR
ncbi:MAG: transglycosylase SLT domain-containing protein [Neisseria sp.]|nr:transglycosylase SLT domain-containing protein [Neisseria sp.]